MLCIMGRSQVEMRPSRDGRGNFCSLCAVSRSKHIALAFESAWQKPHSSRHTARMWSALGMSKCSIRTSVSVRRRAHIISNNQMDADCTSAAFTTNYIWNDTWARQIARHRSHAARKATGRTPCSNALFAQGENALDLRQLSSPRERVLGTCVRTGAAEPD